MDALNISQDLRNIDIRKIDPAELVDIRDVQTRRELPKEERIREFIRQIRNPYCFRVGKVAVKVSYAENGASLEERLESLFMKYN